MNFITDDFLLTNSFSQKLYHKHAENLPIADYHCHLIPEEIAKDEEFQDITQIWLKGDHYKWRLMRNCGISEEYISGNGDSREKFRQWIKVLEKCIGNPIYHWCHMELNTYFGYRKPVTSAKADEIYDYCNDIIRRTHMSPRKLIEMSKVTVICTTDSPEDDLKWHKIIREDESFTTKVLPTYRPDKLVNAAAENYAENIHTFGARYNTEIRDLAQFTDTIRRSVEFFAENGCKVSDHGIEKVTRIVADREEADAIFRKALAGEKIAEKEQDAFQNYMLGVFAGLYKEFGWVMQIHYGAERNINGPMFEKIGPDTGYDCIANGNCGSGLAALLNRLESADILPKAVIYSLNPNDNAAIDTICGSYSEPGVMGKIQHGSAWWFNDHIDGMRNQMKELAAKGMLANFVGMLTDSRSFLSYARHDYFRRILCELISQWVISGQYPENEELLGEIVEDISYNNTMRYFGF